VDRSR
jgi:hypothetical protein